MRKKTLILGLCTIVCTILCALFAMIPIQTNNANYPVSWMINLPDNAKIETLSIPGTHDSGALHSIFDVSGKCQDLSIEQQLNVGVRFFDLRLQNVNDKMQIVHSFVDQRLTFASVMQSLDNFLKEHPSEFLIISIKKDADDKNSTKEFEELLLEELKPFKNADFATNLPKNVGEARGKMFFISRYYSSTIGISAYSGWLDSTTFELGDLYVQDNYCINDVETKKMDIASAILFSQNNSERLVLNFSSCYLDSGFPPIYALGTAKNINDWLNYYLSTINGPTGIIIADYMTAELSKSIYSRNFNENAI